MAKERYNFLIDKDIYRKFSEICEREGLVRGKQVELAMREFLKRRRDG
jgi:hypothetical protein